MNISGMNVDIAVDRHSVTEESLRVGNSAKPSAAAVPQTGPSNTNGNANCVSEV